MLTSDANWSTHVHREEMQKRGLSLEDGAVMRYLVDFPGGLELHIGVGLAIGFQEELCRCLEDVKGQRERVQQQASLASVLRQQLLT